MSLSIIEALRGFTSYREAAAAYPVALGYDNQDGTPEERLRELVQMDLEMLADFVVKHREDMLASQDLIEFNRLRGRVCSEWVWQAVGASAGLSFAAKEEYLELVALVDSFLDK